MERLQTVLGGVVLMALAVAYTYLVSPHRQFRVAKEAYYVHMDDAHPPIDLVLSAYPPTKLSRWTVAGKSLPPPYNNHLKAELNFSLIINNSVHDLNLLMFLVGSVAGRSVEIGHIEWRKVWNEFPEHRSRYLSNPKEVRAGAVIEGTVPFLMAYDSEMEDQEIKAARLVVKENRSQKQRLFALPLPGEAAKDLKW